MVGDLAELTTTGAPPASPPRAFHLLAKPTGAVCNLDCSYCFFLSKEMLYPGSRFRMAEELLETYIRQLIEAHASVPEVTIAWQGGEPTLMGVEFFRRSVELAEPVPAPGTASASTRSRRTARSSTRSGRRSSRRTTSSSASRSTGRSALHDAYRVNKGGKGSFTDVMRGLGHLREAESRLERADDRARRERRSRP